MPNSVRRTASSYERGRGAGLGAAQSPNRRHRGKCQPKLAGVESGVVVYGKNDSRIVLLKVRLVVPLI